MKKIVVMVFVVLLFCFNSYSHGQQPNAPAKAEVKTLPAPGGPSSGPGPMPGAVKDMPQAEVGEIFFAAGTISADDKFLYVILDRFLLQYVLPTLELKRKVELDIAVAPITPTISISKDSTYIYVIYNGILYQIDAAKLKIEKQIKITP